MCHVLSGFQGSMACSMFHFGDCGHCCGVIKAVGEGELAVRSVMACILAMIASILIVHMLAKSTSMPMCSSGRVKNGGGGIGCWFWVVGN